MKMRVVIRLMLLWIMSGNLSLLANRDVRLCKTAAPSLSCDLLSKDDLKVFKNLCEDSSISKTCGNSLCDGDETDANCPKDCRGGLDFSLVKEKLGSYNGRTNCPNVKKVERPLHEKSIIEIVKSSVKQGLTVKAVGTSHTDNAMICTDGVVVSTEKMKQVLGLSRNEDGEEIVRVEPGVSISDLGAWLYLQHRSLEHAIVGYGVVTVAGIIGTGAHGSSIRATSLLSDVLNSVRIVMVDSYNQVQVKTFSKATTGVTDPDLWRALKVNLGMFGIITELSFLVKDDFQVNMVTKSYTDETLYAGESILPLIKDCGVVSASYFPPRDRLTRDQGKIIVNCGEIIAKPDYENWDQFYSHETPGAQYALHSPEVQEWLYDFYIDKLHVAACDSGKSRLMEILRRHQLASSKSPYLFRDRSGKLEHQHEGIRGPSHLMQNSGGSALGHFFRQTDWEVAVPFSRWAEAFNIARELLTEKNDSGDDKLFLSLMGIYLRFGLVSDTLLSHAAVGGDFKLGEPVMFMEIPQFIPTFNIKDNDPRTRVFAEAIKSQYESPYKEFVTRLMREVGARVHWAKNREELFDLQQKDPVRSKQLKIFGEQVIRLDPNGVFSNPFAKSSGVRLDKPSHSEL